MSRRPVSLSLDELRLGPTAALFEGGPRAGIGITSFVVQTPPGRFVELHVHPYSETFVLLRGHGRWTVHPDGLEAEPVVIEPDAEHVIVVPPDTPHGFRNVGDEPLLVVTIQESPELVQTFLGVDPR